MNTQPEALRLADALQRAVKQLDPEDHVAQIADWYLDDAAAELRRLQHHELAHIAWIEKTEWVQDTVKPHELGMHRADVIKQRFDRLHALNQELLELLQAIVKSLSDRDDEGLIEHAQQMIDARAAIAKAQGESR